LREEGDSMMAPREARVPPATIMSQVRAEPWERSRERSSMRILIDIILQMIIIDLSFWSNKRQITFKDAPFELLFL
jgi:hypothetical protein